MEARENRNNRNHGINKKETIQQQQTRKQLTPIWETKKLETALFGA